MNADLRKDAYSIINTCLKEMQPGDAVRRALKGQTFSGRLFLLAVGKAAWPMADAAHETLGGKIERGIVVTKYKHSRGQIGAIDIYEAGHPVPDENSYKAADAALEMVSELGESDTLLLLLSGGGSALFEKPLVPPEEIQDINKQLLSCGAEISEMNTIRKRLSAVKGGRLAEACRGSIYQIILSDVIGDRLDMIASGPAAADSSTCDDAMAIVSKYGLRLSDAAKACLNKETPKSLRNVKSEIVGSVRLLCEAAAKEAEQLGYKAEIMTDSLDCEASDAGKMLAKKAVEWTDQHKDGSASACAFIYGGETVVHIKGTGLGGRNQELALSAAKEIEGLENVLIFSLGSDGTDGPTDAAGGIVDGQTATKLREKDISIEEIMANNDSYNALKEVDGLIMTGPTGTNVNDVSVLLVQP